MKPCRRVSPVWHLLVALLFGFFVVNRSEALPRASDHDDHGQDDRDDHHGDNDRDDRDHHGRIWYVEADARHDGNGTKNRPFRTLQEVEDHSSPGDTIFVYAGSGSYGGGIALDANQQLIGERAGLTVNGHLLAFAFFNDGISTTLAHVIQDHMTITLASANYTGAEVARAKRSAVFPPFAAGRQKRG